jgi:excisionase family DNA binding protein
MKVLSLSETARLWGRGRSTLYELIAAGALRAKKMGSRTVILESDLDAYLASLPDAVEVGAIRAARSASAA